MQEVAYAVAELRRLDDERRADERAAIERERARAAAELVRERERAEARELTERVARIEADAAVAREAHAAAREAHAAERARLELEVARARVPAPEPAPVRLAPVWIAMVATAMCAIGAAWWSAGRIDDEQRRADALIDRLHAQIDALPAPSPVVVNVPAAPAVAPTARPAPVPVAHPAPHATPATPPPHITVCGEGSPLGCL